MLKLSTAILIFFLCFSLYAQKLQWDIETITIKDGLRSDAVTAIIKDRQGFLWFGTKMGLHRFDGYQLKTYKNDLNDSASLAHNRVSDLCEDHSGNLWITSPAGVSRLNPETDQITHYMHISSDSAGVCRGLRKRVFVDSRDNVWVGTARGLDRHDKDRDSFLHYGHNSKENNSSGAETISCIYEDKDNTLWIGTRSGGLMRMVQTNKTFQRFLVNPNEPSSRSNTISCISEDSSGNLWIGTGDGLFLFDRNEFFFSRVLDKEGQHNAPQSQIFVAVHEDPDGNYWIRTYSGLYLYDARLKRMEAWEHTTRNPVYGVWENIRSLYQDANGTIWYGKHYRGIVKLVPKKNQFRFYRNNPNFEDHEIRSVLVENKDIIWIGTFSGLSRWNRRNNAYRFYQYDPEDENTISNNHVNHIFKDHTGILWIATANGLNKLEDSGNGTYKFVHYNHNPSDPLSISSNLIVNICEDNSGSIYISGCGGQTERCERKIDVYDRENDSFLHLEYALPGFQDKATGYVCLAETGRLWVHNNDEVEGLLEIKLPLHKNSQYTLSPDTIIQYIAKAGRLNSNDVIYMHKDPTGNYWIGTEGGGLNKMSVKKSNSHRSGEIQFEYFTTEDGLCSDFINLILEDNKGKLWLGTSNGISRFDPISNSFTNYDKTDGLITYDFTFDCAKSPDGELFFRSNKGLLAFHPDSIVDNPIVPPIVITDFQLFNQTVQVGDKSPLSKNISYTTDIKLPYNQNFLSFEYAALNYLHTEKNNYKYKMIGLDQDWIEAGTRRYADYPDLKPGEYTFRVLGSNNDGIWNMEGASLKISILPPWWATNYAYMLYGLVAVLLLLGYGRLRTFQIRKQRKMLEKQVKERTEQIVEQKEEIESQKETLEKQNMKILELDQLKSKFFNNISHEFRTPLTLIQGPVEDLLATARLKKNEISKLNMVTRNTKRLLNLVNQLLDIARLESGRMKLKLVEDDIFQHLHSITASFSSMAEAKGILYNRLIPRDRLVTWFDPGALEKIITNLLSNAFKFTSESGEVAFKAKLVEGPVNAQKRLELSISDEGPGIPEDALDKIFTRFYQVGPEHEKTIPGTGIGLSLVRDLVELYHGKIQVQSEPGIGSEFIVSLPLGKDHLKKDEFDLLIEKEDPRTDTSENQEHLESLIETVLVSQHKSKEAKPIVLIVDDNSDIRRHISDNMKYDFQIIEAVNGSAGLKKALEIIPDLILTDLIMPGMDGIALCRNAKGDERTSHIPIVMLTAKSSMEEKLQGLETGADDYVSKPFNMKELKTRVSNLIEQRKKLREQFSKEITLEPNQISVTPLDEEFLKKAIDIVERNIADEHFTLSQFQDAMHMSHSTLFRKLYALTNLSPTSFIRNIRLKRAAQLLEEQYGNVAKVSFEVGFNNPSYFSKCFKSLFGVSPANYLKKKKDVTASC